jgi:hypothetical protein
MNRSAVLLVLDVLSLERMCFSPGDFQEACYSSAAIQAVWIKGNSRI